MNEFSCRHTEGVEIVCCSTCPSVATSPLTSCRLRPDVPRGLAHDPFLFPVCHRVNLASRVFVSCFGFAAWRSTPLWRNFPNLLYSTSGCASRVQYMPYAPPRLFPSIRNRSHVTQQRRRCCHAALHFSSRETIISASGLVVIGGRVCVTVSLSLDIR